MVVVEEKDAAPAVVQLVVFVVVVVVVGTGLWPLSQAAMEAPKPSSGRTIIAGWLLLRAAAALLESRMAFEDRRAADCSRSDESAADGVH